MAIIRTKQRASARSRHERAKRIGIAALGGYDAQLEAQGGGCAICGRTPKTRRLNIDHHHKSGSVRGLLCHKCNRGLAMFQDNPNILQGASYYLAHGWHAAMTYRCLMAAEAK